MASDRAQTVRPWRTGAPARPDVPLPPTPMPAWLGTRPLKRWRWVGCFDERVLLCAAVAHVGPAPVAWWAVWDREERTLAERTVHRRGVVGLETGRVRVDDGPVAIDLVLTEDAGVETVSPHGPKGYAWTRKQGRIAVRGTVRMGEREFAVDARGIVDDSAGYHARRTDWHWSAGVGVTTAGDAVAWNLCAGLHDDPAASERSVWVGGVPHEVGPVRFADDLTGVGFAEGGALRFVAEAARAHHEQRGLVASDYEAPFGTFAGVLPGAGELATGLGVMERHSAKW